MVAASSRLGSSSKASSSSSPSRARADAIVRGRRPRSPSTDVPGAKRATSPPRACTRTSPRTPWTRRTWATRSSAGTATADAGEPSSGMTTPVGEPDLHTLVLAQPGRTDHSADGLDVTAALADHLAHVLLRDADLD